MEKSSCHLVLRISLLALPYEVGLTQISLEPELADSIFPQCPQKRIILLLFSSMLILGQSFIKAASPPGHPLCPRIFHLLDLGWRLISIMEVLASPQVGPAGHAATVSGRNEPSNGSKLLEGVKGP